MSKLKLKTTVQCPVFDSFRVQQIAGMFNVPLAERCRETFEVELPTPQADWSIGVIVGPSGSGKSTVARAAFGESLYTPQPWPRERAVIDGFGETLSTKTLTSLLTAVGFSSPPSWVKPYQVLSNGERFRCDLARALLPAVEDSPSQERIVVFDEFSSVVDRTVARVGSIAVAKTVRGRLNQRLEPTASQNNSSEVLQTKPPHLRFVAVTCHYDVVPWLEPDWVLDMAARQLHWGRLRRPDLVLEVVECPQSWWGLFARHHYLSGSLARAARCYAALWQGVPVAFCATTGMYGLVGRKRITRVVVLPDFQGLGIGLCLVERVCQHEAARGFRVSITASHPSVIGHCKRSPHWVAYNVQKAARRSFQRANGIPIVTAAGRSVVSFEYIGEPVKRAA